jgi:hypothetical protein
MQDFPNFADLESLKRFSEGLRRNHARTLRHYLSGDQQGFCHQPHKRAIASRASTATCVASLVGAGLWTTDWPWWNLTSKIANTLVNSEWASSGLPVDNPFTVPFIAESVLDLRSAFPKYEGSDEHLQQIKNRAVPILLTAIDSGSVCMEY